ncbi:Inner membrane protein albino3 [Musa troglodytarum]|uniref:Inner membrane protein albino3 n=1 Tax=Musa troglodytarum TaxID=320322 RepID=A0A9E7HK37_9LILI|nr:Inner membrane protein albino3 [Musa troglodytarum]
MSFQDIPPVHGADSLAHLHGIVSRVESLLFTLADATAPTTDASTVVQKNGGWFGFISDAMEVVLKVLKDVLTAIHVPYAYGFAIILLTVIVKVLTFPLTKQQVESTLAMQNLQPKIKAIQERYKGNQDGHPPLGWSDTAAYLVLPVLLVISQYVSMEIMKPPQTDDPASKNSLLVFKFLPVMIGYFSLSVPSGLSIYWFTNNILSTAQQIWLRKLGGAKPAVSGDAGGIISAGRAKRTASQPVQTGERFKQLKDKENRKMFNKALAVEGQTSASTSISDDESAGESNDKGEVSDEAYSSTESKKIPEYTAAPKKAKRSKRKRAVRKLTDDFGGGKPCLNHQSQGWYATGFWAVATAIRPAIEPNRLVAGSVSSRSKRKKS